MKPNKSFKRLSHDIRNTILDISWEAHVGHVGSAFSIVEILTSLYFGILKEKSNTRAWKTSDIFVLSKGHAAPALYATLYERGLISKKDLFSYCQNGSLFEEHPNHLIPSIEVSTGSLGHGLSIGVGYALATRITKKKKNVAVLISDAECNEGEMWEAALSAAHHKLNNLYVFMDYNKTQAFGTTQDVLGLEPLRQKWEAFGFTVYDVDGHNPQSIIKSFQTHITNNTPVLFICHTVRGKGVSFMEHHIDWHYLDPTEEQVKASRIELKKTYA